MRSLFFLALLVAMTACKESKSERPRRVFLHRTGGTTFELKPEDDQLPYCLAYTVTKTGLMRQLTMSRTNESFQCPPGRPIGLRSFKVPLSEGPVRIYVLYTSTPVNAAPIAEEMLDVKDRWAVSPMDLRVPGEAFLDALEFIPEEDVEPTVGAQIGADAGTADAGTDADAGT